MRRIAAYHPTIKIEHGVDAETIELDMDDFYTQQEVQQALADTTGAHTAGEAAQAIKSGKAMLQRCGKVLAARMVDSKPNETLLLGWDQNL